MLAIVSIYIVIFSDCFTLKEKIGAVYQLRMHSYFWNFICSIYQLSQVNDCILVDSTLRFITVQSILLSFGLALRPLSLERLFVE